MEGDCRNPRVSLLKKYDIPIDHLSFEYIETCSDKKELERIVRILRSGEEGIYPDLIKAAENQLRQIAPDSRALRIDAPILTKESISNEEWKDLEKLLLSWEEEMNVMDKTLEFEKQRFDRIGNKNLPEVRKNIEYKPENKPNKCADIKKIKVETNKKNERIKSGDYRAWDKFDVDKELLKIDLEDERKEEKNSKIKRKMEKQEKQLQEKKIEPINIDTDSYSNTEQQILANQAKNLGNESFKSGDYEAALKYYKVSLKLCQNTATFNNRAMTYIKMKNYEAALEDCNEVLKREPNNVKALHRRATSYQNLPGDKHNELALKDLLKIISIEPGNRVAQSDLHTLKMKLNIQDIGKKFRMMIEESGDSERLNDLLSKQSNLVKKSHFNTNDNLTAIRKLPLTYYGPSTSTFQCEPQSMTHRMLSGPIFSGQVMCKCNSNATRQNPLCHRCGERLSRPKKKSKSITKPSPNQSKKEVNAFNEGVKGKSAMGNVLESKKLNADGDNKSDNSVSEKIQEKLGPLIIEEVTTMSADEKIVGKSDIEEKVEKGNVISNDSGGEIGEKTSDPINEANEKSESEKSQFGNNENENLVGNEIGEKGKIENLINDVEKDDNAEKAKVDAKSHIEEPDQNCLFFQELDLSLKENRKDSKNMKDTLSESSIERRRKGESGKSDKLNSVNQNSLIESDNRSLPTTSGIGEPKPETKKARSRKKKSKESRQDGIRLRYSEPVKILQATKYLKPTSSEPKPEIDTFKECQRDGISETKPQFSSFLPNRNLLDRESGVLKSTTTSYSSNINGKENRVSPPQGYAVNNMTRHCEGNKENIMEGGNEKNSHRNNYSRDDSFGLGSSFEFVKSWESMKKNDESYEKRAEIIRLLRPEDLKTVIGNNLDSDMLKSLLECLEKHFLNNDPKMVVSFLKELPRIPRFGVVNLFLSSNERKVLERLIENTEKNGFVLDEEVKNSLKVSF